MENSKFNLFIGRFQPLHKGHIKLIKTVLDEGKNVLVAIRDTPISETDPYTFEEREQMFKEQLPQVKVIKIPDIEAVCYGRKVGYKIREIKLDSETESISATEIRKKL